MAYPRIILYYGFAPVADPRAAAEAQPELRFLHAADARSERDRSAAAA